MITLPGEIPKEAPFSCISPFCPLLGPGCMMNNDRFCPDFNLAKIGDEPVRIISVNVSDGTIEVRKDGVGKSKGRAELTLVSSLERRPDGHYTDLRIFLVLLARELMRRKK